MSDPILHYFQIRGRGEPIRMTFAACGAKFSEVGVDFASMKSNAGSAEWPFGQAPVLEVGGARISQMQAIMRYVAATYKPELCGSTHLERAQVDMLLASIDDLYTKYIGAVYGGQLSDEAKATLWKDHFDGESKSARNGGAHLAYLNSALERSGGTFLINAQLTIADILFYFALECFTRTQCFGAKVFEAYPSLKAYFDAVAASSGIKERLADPSRADLKVNNNGKG
eukprot:TRINITY_DN7262_c0_g1_i1.p1 TRINITY_DN7262_c0_g1~~TRINITY_DN7262_c0_g1_i1.p1  ORF type:complete len:227 (+),score=25.07 TRINITY_DN7262_c0_g1_i1:57-737(+)